ncbi:hypothetical protein MD484_g4814, partial [Candolleomyces efflorescens]
MLAAPYLSSAEPQAPLMSPTVASSFPARTEVISPTFANSGSPSRDPRRPTGMTVLPPQYSALSVAALPAYPNAAELDIGSSADRTSSYARRSFEFNTAPHSPGGTASWVSLKLFSNAPKTAQRPRYVGGEKVEGTVILDCTEKRAQVVHSVVVILRGRVVTSSLTEGSQVFLEHVHPVWKNDAVPQSPTAVASPPALAGGKLSGRVELPFDFVFPTEFSAGGKDSNSKSTSSQQHSTPQTLMERGVSATVLYEITLKVISGAFFRSTQKIVANVLYVPVLKPPQLPEERANAYRTGSYLPSPLQSEEGWSALAPIKLRLSRPSSTNGVGRVEGVEICCTAYVAKPVVYVRGTVIPCYLICKPDASEPSESDSSDNHKERRDLTTRLLEDFASQQCLSLGLQRRLVYFTDSRQMASSVIANGIKVSNGSNAEGTSDTTREVGSAVWWNPLIMSGAAEDAEQDAAGDASAPAKTPSVTSLLEGEIHLDSDLFPTCDLPFLSASYTVSASITSTTQDLIVERVLPTTVLPPSPPVSPRSSRRFSKRLSQILSPSSVKNAINAANEALKNLENVASTPVQIVTVKEEGDPIPVTFMPRSAPKKVDLSIVREVEYSGVVVAGFV